MFKLIKLCMYGLFAYFIYELVLGMTQEIEQKAQSAADDEHEQKKQPQGNPREGGNQRGRSRQRGSQSQAQRGMPVRVEDSNGAMSTRRAGRGVVHE